MFDHFHYEDKDGKLHSLTPEYIRECRKTIRADVIKANKGRRVYTENYILFVRDGHAGIQFTYRISGDINWCQAANIAI